MSAVTDLQAAQAAQTTTVQSVVAYLQGLPAMIASAQGADDAAIATIVAQVQADTAALQTAQAAAPV